METKYKIGLGINYWDDPQGLLRILYNSYDNVYVIYLIDGRYVGRNDIEEHLPTLAEEIAKQYPKIHYVKIHDSKQIEKRNKYFELAEKDNIDFLIVLDSDEYLEFYPELEDSLNKAMDMKWRCFPCAESWKDVVEETPRPRLFKKPFVYRHRQNPNGMISHGSIWDKDGKDVIPEMYGWCSVYGERKSIPGLKLIQDKIFRTKKRVDLDYLYYENNPLR